MKTTQRELLHAKYAHAYSTTRAFLTLVFDLVIEARVTGPKL
jgi:hypothetical protein